MQGLILPVNGIKIRFLQIEIIIRYRKYRELICVCVWLMQ